MRLRLLIMALLLGVYGLADAQENAALLSDPDKDNARLEGSVPPPSVTWVPEDYITLPGSFRKGAGVPIDTLDVGDSNLQIILRDDFTWSYVKNMKKVAESDVFRECWVENILNPYANVQLSDLGYRNTICLIDSVSTFVCPYVGKVYSRFGYRRGRRHQGTDVPLVTGTPVKSAFDGRVRYAHRTSGYGNLVIIRHENGLETYYGHLSKINVEPGQWVRAGEVIGLGGSTGRSSGPHLHFETRYKGYAFDPEWIVDFENGVLRKNVFVLRRSYLSASSRYIPESIDEEEDIYATDEKIIEEEKRIEAEKAAMKWHTVKSGDTVSAIARKYGKTQSQIVKLNPGLKVDKISIGQKIRVN